MSKAKAVFENLIKVRPLKKKLQLNAEKCDDVFIPDSYKEKGGGVDADLVIFVALDDTGFYKANKIEAAATYCLQDEDTRRPIAGFINFRPGMITTNSTTNLDYMVWLALHEMTHIFVFNDGLYEDFIDENMNPYNISDIVGSKILSTHKKINFLKTKKLLEVARKHFNCSDLDGVPLEFMGGAGTAGSHWSKRVMNTDYMIGDSYGENLISEISLALFEDSGWYKADYDKSNLFLWGKNEGCEFLNMEKKCIREQDQNNALYNNIPLYNNSNNNYNTTEKEDNFYEEFLNITSRKHLRPNKNVVYSNNNIENKKSDEKDDKEKRKEAQPKFRLDAYETDFKNEFCTKLNYPVCSNSHIFRGNCRVKKYKFPIQSSEAYFSDKFVGGLSKLANKCPIPIEDKTKNSNYSGSCRKGTYRSYQLAIEKICPECSCFMSNLVPKRQRSEIYDNNNEENTEKRKSKIDFTFVSVTFSDIVLPFTSVSKNVKDSKLREIDDSLNEENDLNEKVYKLNNGMTRMQSESELEIKKKDLIPVFTEEDYKAMCFEFKCKEKDLYVVVDDKDYKCVDNKVILQNYKGEIVCPPSEVICDRKYLCKYGCTEKYQNDK